VEKKALKLGVALCLCSSVAWADSTDDAVARANRSAYRLAMECFVAEGVARGYDLHVGDTARADALERRARVSFDTAMKLGDELGYSGTRMNEDLGLTQSAEVPKFDHDVNYLKSQIAKCESVGI